MDPSADPEHSNGGTCSPLSSSKFTYREQLELGEVRLLELEAGRGHERLRCRLFTCQLYGEDNNVSPTYHALSYVWGDPSSPREITCNDHSIEITRNLFDALWQLRESGDLTPLWVDAICINQKDEQEKTAQVRMMGFIYALASRTVIWLGPASEIDDQAIALIRRLHTSLNNEDFYEGHERRPRADLDTVSLSLPDLRGPEWKAFFSLASRPWFGRAWIIQEFILSTDSVFRFGTSEVSRKEFIFAASALRFDNVRLQLSLFQHERMSASWLSQWQVEYQDRPNDVPLVEILALSRSFSATEPKDKYFALAGLATDVSADFVDYSKTLSEITIEVAKCAISAHHVFKSSGLDLLSFVNGKRFSSDLPSWIPDFTDNNDSFQPLCLRYSSSDMMSETSSEIHISESDQSLGVTVRLMDEVKATVDEIPYLYPIDTDRFVPAQAAQRAKNINDIADWANTCRNLFFQAQLKGKWLPMNTFWRTLIFNRTADGEVPPDEFAENYSAWLQMLKTGVTPLTQSSSWYAYVKRKLLILFDIGFLVPYIMRSNFSTWYQTCWTIIKSAAVLALAHSFSWAILFSENISWMWQMVRIIPAARPFEAAFGTEFLRGRKFFLSKEGHIGWVTFEAASGDVICAIKGCRIPFVVRPVQGGYRLIGDCYMFGFMDGEAEKLPIVFQDIKIK